MKARIGRLGSAALAALTVLTAVVALAGPASAANDYKATGEFERGSCVDFVASRLKATGVNRNGMIFKNNWANGYRAPNGTTYFGNAENWDDYASALGYGVDQRPTVGSVAQWNAGEKSTFPGGWKSAGTGGHVAYVTKVYSDGLVDLEEYNQNNDHAYHAVSRVQAPRYIHLHHVVTFGAYPFHNRLQVWINDFTPGAARLYYARGSDKFTLVDIAIGQDGRGFFVRDLPCGTYQLLVGDSARHATNPANVYVGC